MSKKEDQLFLLIKSLSKSQKRYIKVNSPKDSQTNYIQLFDAMDKMKFYNESKLLSKFKGTNLVNHLPSEKNYLYETILKSMRLYISEGSARVQIHALIQDIILLYEKGLSTEEIVNRLDSLVDRNDLIVADNAEPRLIAEIRAKGFNIVPCTKGADSIRLGLVKMMDYKIVVTPDSRNLQKELSNYVWNDKKSNTPKSNGYDHLIDACRYAFDELVEDNQFYFS